MRTFADGQIRTFLKEELAQLKEDMLAPHDIPDDLPLFDVNQDGSENLGLDSLDALELACAVEERYGVQMPRDLDFKELATVNDIVAFVVRLAEQQDGAG